MSRPLRMEFAGAVNHVVARGHNRALIFHSDADRREYLRLLTAATERKGWVLLAYCLMPNHVHLLIETPQPNLASGMQWFHGLYGRYFNDRYERVGQVFQGRYKSVRQETDAQFERVRVYIALNPVAAGLVHPGRSYPWARDFVGRDGYEPGQRV
jgi:putative transposase